MSHGLSCAGAEDEPLEQRVAGQPVGPVHTGARDLARCKQPGERRPAVDIRLHAPHHIVSGRTDRNPVPGQVEAGTPAGVGNQRKALVHEIGVQLLEGEEDGPPGSLCLAHDGARDTIAGRQIARRIVAGHERLPVAVQQPGAFAAKRLRQQEPRLTGNVESGRVELDELEIRDGRAGTIGHGDTIAGRHVRVGGFAVDLSGAAGREQHERRARDRQASIVRKEAGTRRAAILDKEIDHPCVCVCDDPRQGGRARPEHAPDLAPGRIVCVQDAARTVGPFDGELGLTIGSAVETRAPLHQLSYVAGAVFDQHADGAFVAETVAGRHRVRRMELRRIAWPDGRRDAPLRVAGVAFPRLGLGEDEDIAGSRELRRRAERSDAAADDDEIRAKLHARPDAAILPSPQP